jgi:hypothetical protein
MEREVVPYDGNSQQSFVALPLEPNGQIKTRVHKTKYHPIQQTLGMKLPMEFASGAFRNPTLLPNR